MTGRQAIEFSKLSKPFDLHQSMSALIEIYFGDQVGFISALTGCAVATAGGIRVRSPGPTGVNRYGATLTRGEVWQPYAALHEAASAVGLYARMAVASLRAATDIVAELTGSCGSVSGDRVGQ